MCLGNTLIINKVINFFNLVFAGLFEQVLVKAVDYFFDALIICLVVYQFLLKLSDFRKRSIIQVL